jgi:hypothetical protein
MFRSIWVLTWPKAEIKRDRFAVSNPIVVPAICPNCMAEATVGHRTDHQYFLSNTTHYQTFWYCRDCFDAIRHEPVALKWLIAIVAGAAAGFVLFQANIGEHVAIVATTGIAILAGVMTLVVRRRAYPLPNGALGRRPPAYYTGQSLGGFGTRDIYRARRPEWLNLLVRANPDKSTDASYSELTGQAKPEVTKEKPF